MKRDALNWQEKLRRVGLRLTASRLAVLDAVAAGPHHDAETIAAQARERLGALSTQAVYDNLHALVAAELVRRIEPAGHPARYEARVGTTTTTWYAGAAGPWKTWTAPSGPRPAWSPLKTTVTGSTKRKSPIGVSARVVSLYPQGTRREWHQPADRALTRFHHGETEGTKKKGVWEGWGWGIWEAS